MKNIIHSLRKQGYRVGVQHFRPVLFPDGRVLLSYYSRHTKTNGKVLAKGGFTRLTITNSDGKEVGSAVAQCSEKDLFCYRNGVTEAYLKLRPAIELTKREVM